MIFTNNNGTYVWSDDDEAPMSLLESTAEVFARYRLEGANSSDTLVVEYHQKEVVSQFDCGGRQPAR